MDNSIEAPTNVERHLVYLDHILLGMAILLAVIAIGLTIGYVLNRMGKLDDLGTDKTEIKAAIVASRDAVRRRVAEAPFISSRR